VNIETYTLQITLSYNTNTSFNLAGSIITLADNMGASYSAATDINGTATFRIPQGIYSASTNLHTANGIILNGLTPHIIVTQNTSASITLEQTKPSSIIIKELYCGGCQTDDGSGSTFNDKYTILYNNSALPITIQRLCLAMVMPYNATGTNPNYINGQLCYASQGFVPAAMGIWYAQDTLQFEPYGQKTISIYGAINHTIIYSNSVNLANKGYYVLYDETCERYAGESQYYPAPYEGIPTSNYFRTIVYAPGTCWIMSSLSPAFFIFDIGNINPIDFANDKANHYFDGNTNGTWGLFGSCLRIPYKYIIDGVEVFSSRYDGNQKRLPQAIDAGYVWHTNQYGYSIYRNVDQQATESLPENNGKIVYGYSLGTENIERGSTDPSNIDAEASIKAGAHIVYLDTKNSSLDFHQRSKASIKQTK
jgi:hypothetical protein